MVQRMEQKEGQIDEWVSDYLKLAMETENGLEAGIEGWWVSQYDR